VLVVFAFQNDSSSYLIRYILERQKTSVDFEAIANIACNLPNLDPFDQSIKNFTEEKVDPPKCLLKYPAVFKLGFNFSLIKESNTSEWGDCCYKIIYRSNTTAETVDSEIILAAFQHNLY